MALPIILFTSLLLAIVAMTNGDLADGQQADCAHEVRLSFANWRTWTPVLRNPMVSAGHGNNWVGIFVDDLAKPTYLSAGATYPECARIVKPIYHDTEGTAVRKLTIMVKMRAGYDPNDGNWWYAHASPRGTNIGRRGRLGGCIPCHKQAAVGAGIPAFGERMGALGEKLAEQRAERLADLSDDQEPNDRILGSLAANFVRECIDNRQCVPGYGIVEPMTL